MNADLLQASQIADIIRRAVSKHQQSQSQTSNSSRLAIPPGLAEGVVVGIFVAGLTLPLRRILLREAGSRLHTFADLVVTPLQALVSVQAGIYSFSIHGSAAYLQQLADVPKDQPSAIADDICYHTNVRPLWESTRVVGSSGDEVFETAKDLSNSSMALPDANSFDPREKTLELMRKALKRCGERDAFRNQGKKQLK